MSIRINKTSNGSEVFITPFFLSKGHTKTDSNVHRTGYEICSKIFGGHLGHQIILVGAQTII